MERNVQLVKVGDDEQSSRFGNTHLQAVLQINRRNHLVTRHENAFYAGMCIGNGRHRLVIDNLRYFCHVDAVGIARYGKFQDFQFICPVFQ